MRSRQRFLAWLLYTAVFVVCTGAGALLAQSLPTQVLQLLQRTNTWTGQQTFSDMRVPLAAIPSDTSTRIYADLSGNLYYNGGLIAGAGGGVTPHNLFSTTHPDTLTGSPVRGDIAIANSTPLWTKLAIGASGTLLRSNGTDPSWSTDGSGLTALNATQLTSGTVPLARIGGLLNAQIDAAAAIGWSKIDKSGSSLADLTTRSAGDLSSGTLSDSRLSTNVSLFGSSVGTAEIDGAAITAAKLADFGCTAGQAMTWQLSGWTCGTFGTGSGTVTSVALSLPATFTVTGSPITTTGTLTATYATQTANTVFSGPSSAGPSAPTFRALVNADLPLSGVGAGTYVSVTVNTAGVVTAGSTSLNLATQVGATILPFANGGTGLSAAADDTAMVSNGTAWQAKTLPNCTTTPLGYTQATNLFSCLTTLSGMTAITTTTATETTANITTANITTGNVTTDNITTGNITTLVVGGGSNVTKIITGTTTWDPPNLNNGASESTTLTVTGAATGLVCLASLTSLTTDELVIAAYPSAADTVKVVLYNGTGGAVDLGSGTLRATCIKHT